MSVGVGCSPITYPGDNRPDIFVVNSGANIQDTEQNRIYINDHATAADDPSMPTVAISAYPNPFKGSSTFRLASTSGPAPRLDVYNLRGQKVRSWDLAIQGAGGCSVNWDGKDEQGTSLPAGVYLVVPQTGVTSVLVKVVRLCAMLLFMVSRFHN